MTVSLFEGRHDLPENLGPLCSEFDFQNFKAVKTDLWSAAKCTKEVNLYVTGLTAALIQFIAEFQGERLNLYHYDRDSNSYKVQVLNFSTFKVLFSGTCWHGGEGCLMLLSSENLKVASRDLGTNLSTNSEIGHLFYDELEVEETLFEGGYEAALNYFNHAL